MYAPQVNVQMWGNKRENKINNWILFHDSAVNRSKLKEIRNEMENLLM